tara:strand:+ start:45 stop:356 length:312 start_codon:yes stop_codon:yes gene_type:complete
MIFKILKKLKKPKKRTNQPMIVRTGFEAIGQKEGFVHSKAARQRLRRIAQDTSLAGQGRQMVRYFKKASPKKKAVIIGATVGPKAALVGTGYFLGEKDKNGER